MDRNFWILLSLGFVWICQIILIKNKINRLEKQQLRLSRDMAVLRAEYARKGVIDG